MQRDEVIQKLTPHVLHLITDFIQDRDEAFLSRISSPYVLWEAFIDYQVEKFRQAQTKK